MTVHLVKLCVGIASVEELADWQQSWQDEQKAAGQKPELIHVTRSMPKRAEELVKDGSIYWVIKGHIQVRQRILELRRVTKNGSPHCGIVCAPELVRTLPRFYDPFQGWRYLSAKDAPPDAKAVARHGNLPDALKVELAELGLL